MLAAAEVIQPEDAGAGFRDVGALAGPKAALREAVQLPLQHPALFVRGPLARPCRGVLLFGPPGEPADTLSVCGGMNTRCQRVMQCRSGGMVLAQV